MSIKPFLVLPLILITIGISQLKDEHSAKLHKAAEARATINKSAPAVAAPKVEAPAPTATPAPTPAPTPVATPAPAPRPVVVSNNRGYAHPVCAQYFALVDAYPWDTRTMMAIMEAESGCYAGNVGTNRDAYGNVTSHDYGLFQINQEPIMDPAANVRRAYGKYTSQGLGAWTVYKTGAYIKYLR